MGSLQMLRRNISVGGVLTWWVRSGRWKIHTGSYVSCRARRMNTAAVAILQSGSNRMMLLLRGWEAFVGGLIHFLFKMAIN